MFGFPHCPWGKQPDVEDVESEFPVLHLYQKMLPNTCGFGRRRGGAGAAIAYVTHHVPYIVWTSTTKEVEASRRTRACSAGTRRPSCPGSGSMDTDVIGASRNRPI